jgi:hypothetical protein
MASLCTQEESAAMTEDGRRDTADGAVSAADEGHKREPAVGATVELTVEKRPVEEE